MPEKLIVSVSPHIISEETVPKVMYGVILALVPAVIASLYFFGVQAIWLIVTCILTALLTEFIFQRLRRKSVTVTDGSAVITGLLLALILPPSFPLWAAVLGAVVAIALGKQIFGGLGHNIFNPALIGRAFLAATFPVLMTTWRSPFDAVTTATPLAMMKFEGVKTPYLELFLGSTAGSLGETSSLALLVGAGYLLFKGYIDWRIPASFLSTVAVFGGTFWIINPGEYPNPLFHLLAGGLMLGALFMATDPVTTPVTKRGRWVFGLGAGVLVIIIRLWGGLPEGVMYSILLMNGLTPLINKYTLPRRFGETRISRKFKVEEG